MKTIIVDDDEISAKLLEAHCNTVSKIDVVGIFSDGLEALDYVKKHSVDFALLDVEMPKMNGLTLGEQLREYCPKMVIIYVTAHSEYVADTLKVKADYCILKPYDNVAIKEAFERAKLLAKRMEPPMKVETFGRFEIFAGEKAIRFGNSKARELFAYCVHREGANVSMEEAIDLLWPERVYDDRVKRLYRKAVSAIINTLKKYDLQNCFENKRGSCQICKEHMDCDLFRFLQDGELDANHLVRLREGYMAEYSWAEERMGLFLDKCPDLYEE